MCKGNEKRLLTTVTTLLGLTLFAISANLLSATAKSVGGEFGQSEALFVKWTMPVQFLGFVVLCFLGGMASDRLGKRVTLLMSCIIMSIGSIVWVLAPNIWVLYAGAVVVGMSGGVMETVACAGLTDLHPTKNKLFMNLSQVFYCIGAISVGSWVGSLLERGVAWQAFYVVMAVFGVLLAVCFALSRFPQKASEVQTKTGPGGLAVAVKLFPKVWLPALAVFLYVFGETALYAFGPNYMKQLGASNEMSTKSIAVFWTFVVIGRIACSFLKQKQTYEFIIVGMFLLSCVAACCQTLVTGWIGGMVLIGLNGLGCSGTWPLLISMVATRNFEYSGTASGIVIGIGALACIISPLTLGSMFDQGHTKGAFLLLGTSFLLGAFCTIGAYFQYRRKKR